MHTIVSMQIYKEWTIFQKKINSCSHMSHRFHVHRTVWLYAIFTQCQGNLNRCFWKSHITTLSTSKKVIFFLKHENIYPWRLLFYTIAWIWQTTAIVMQTIYTIIAIAYTFMHRMDNCFWIVLERLHIHRINNLHQTELLFVVEV